MADDHMALHRRLKANAKRHRNWSNKVVQLIADQPYLLTVPNHNGFLPLERLLIAMQRDLRGRRNGKQRSSDEFVCAAIVRRSDPLQLLGILHRFVEGGSRRLGTERLSVLVPLVVRLPVWILEAYRHPDSGATLADVAVDMGDERIALVVVDRCPSLVTPRTLWTLVAAARDARNRGDYGLVYAYVRLLKPLLAPLPPRDADVVVLDAVRGNVDEIVHEWLKCVGDRSPSDVEFLLRWMLWELQHAMGQTLAALWLWLVRYHEFYVWWIGQQHRTGCVFSVMPVMQLQQQQ
jgi:hypothetical protein